MTPLTLLALIDQLWTAIEALPKPEPQSDAKRPSKQDEVIAMLRRPEGATVDEVATAMGWQRHTVRGLFSGTLKKKLGLSCDLFALQARVSVTHDFLKTADPVSTPHRKDGRESHLGDYPNQRSPREWNFGRRRTPKGVGDGCGGHRSNPEALLKLEYQRPEP